MMVLDMTDPASIAAWRNLCPQRHDAILRALWRLWPQFRQHIERSRSLLKTDEAQPCHSQKHLP